MYRLCALTASLAIASCAAAEWDHLTTAPARQVLPSPAAAVTAGEVTLNVKLAGTVSSSLSSEDRIVSISGKRSFFKVAEVQLAAAQPVEISLAAQCSCIGEKQIFVPWIAVFDEKQTPLPLGASNFQRVPANFKKGPGYAGTWEITPSTTGLYRIVIAADNSRHGQAVTTMEGLMPWPVALPVKSIATGDFELSVRRSGSQPFSKDRTVDGAFQHDDPTAGGIREY